MLTIALVGNDGAGKTSAAKMLVDILPCQAKYMYMGAALAQASHSLPSSRMMLNRKMRSYRQDHGLGKNMPLSEGQIRSVQSGVPRDGAIRNMLRIINRYAEAWYRQSIAQIYLKRGFVVVFDRHFLFDSAHNRETEFTFFRPNLRELEHTMFSRFFPKPDLSFFLDAPSDVLLSRKKELTRKSLDRRRRAILRTGQKLKNFYVIDATDELDAVVDNIRAQSLEHLNSHTDSGNAQINHVGMPWR